MKRMVQNEMDIFSKENITLLISVLGACAWIPIVMEKLCRPKIECKILKCDWLEHAKFHYNIPFKQGLRREINGTIFVICMRLISRNNDFSISNFKVKVKFESMSNEMEAYVHFSSNFYVNDMDKQFVSKMEDNILYCPSLKKDEINDLETHFIIESDKTDVEYMKFVFTNTNGKDHLVVVKRDDFKYALKSFA